MQAAVASSSDDGGGGMQAVAMQPQDDGMQQAAAASSSSSSAPSVTDDTAYRRIERLYRPVHTGGGGAAQKRKGRGRVGTTSASEVEAAEWLRWRAHTIDVRRLDRNTPENRARIIEHTRPECAASSWVSPQARLFSFDGLPGLHVLAGALDANAQAWWAWRALSEYSHAEHTNLTNLEQIKRREADQASVAGPQAASSPSPALAASATTTATTDIWSAACRSGDFSTISKLRWSSLGYHYDWSAREYTAAARSTFPPELAALSSELAAATGFDGLRPEAAICNYYTHNGVMGAHVDDAELTKLAPIVSVSLGCTGVFLLGGRTKHTDPTGFLLRAGDVVIMGGESRVCFHGIPRILDESFGADDDDQQKRQKQENQEAKSNESPPTSNCTREWTPEQAYEKLRFEPTSSSSNGSPSFPSCVGSCVPSRSSLMHALRYLRHARLNLNVRQVEDDAFQYSRGMTSATCRRMNLEEQRQTRTTVTADQSQSDEML